MNIYSSDVHHHNNIHETEAQIRDTYDSLCLLAQTAIDLVDFGLDSNIYRYSAKILKTLSNGAYVVVNSVNLYTGIVKTEAFSGIEELSDDIKAYMGNSIVGAEYKLDQSFFELLSGKLEKFSGGLHELSFGKISKETAAQLEEMLNVGKIYGIGFILDGQIYANAGLIYPKEIPLTNKLAIETFVQQASIVIKRQRTEQELKKSKQSEKQNELLMRITEDLTSVGGWEKDIEKEIFHLSPGCLKIHGVAYSEISTEDLNKTIHPDDLSKVKSEFKAAIEGNGFYNIEHRIIRANDKAERVIRTQGVTIKDKNARPIKMLGAIQDITEEKQINNEITRFRELLDRTNDAIIIHSTDGEHIIDANQTACQLSGFSREELLKKSVFDFDILTDKEIIKQEIYQCGFSIFETQHRIADGTIIYSEVNLSLLETDENSFLVGIIRDISERKYLEKEKEERRKYLETVLNAVPDAVVALDKSHHVVEWNRGAEDLFHYNASEAIGQHLDYLVASKEPGIFQEAQNYSNQVTAGIPTYLDETVRFTKEGAPIDVLLSAAPILIDGHLVGTIGVYVDITKLKKAKTEVKELLVEKDRLIKEVHHRIKNHMNTMYSILSVQASYFSNQEVVAAFEEAKTRIRLMQSIYYKLYSNDDPNKIELSPFIDELARDLQSAYSSLEKISVDTSIENISVSAKDSLPIGIIITELITNSIKYAFSPDTVGEIVVNAYTQDQNTLKIEITDNGFGIPSHVIDNRAYGFGLTLVEGYVRQFDGSFRIDNNTGTHIEVTLLLNSF